MSMEKSYHPCPGCRQFVDNSLYPEHIASNHKDGVYMPPVVNVPPPPPPMPTGFQYPAQQQAYPPSFPPPKTGILVALNNLFADHKHRKAILVLSFIMFAIGWMLRSFFST